MKVNNCGERQTRNAISHTVWRDDESEAAVVRLDEDKRTCRFTISGRDSEDAPLRSTPNDDS
jgi:hypothetical protein